MANAKAYAKAYAKAHVYEILQAKAAYRGLLAVVVVVLLAGVTAPAYGQQFNSDNWWVLPAGTGMGIQTFGQRYSTTYLGFGFTKGWEVDFAPTTYREDPVAGTASHYSTTGYVKALFWENEKQTAGVSGMFGVGQSPGYYQAGTRIDKSNSYWASFPLTVPFIDNAVSWDIMPGIVYNNDYGVNKTTSTGYTYSTRVNIYKIIPQSAIVGEVFGATGEARAEAQYKAGVRWESKYVVAALTYGDTVNRRHKGAGWEIGIMVFTIPYF